MSSHPDQCEAAARNLELAQLDAAFVDDDGGKRIFIRQVFLLAFVAIVASRGWDDHPGSFPPRVDSDVDGLLAWYFLADQSQGKIGFLKRHLMGK
jgi:hypothetical protein